MTIAVNTSNSAQVNSGATTVSASVTTTAANCILVAFVNTSGLGSFLSSTVTGNSLTWHLLHRQADTLSGRSVFLNTIEVWWAVAPTAGTYTPSAALGHAVESGFASIMEVYAVSGVGSLTNPFDATTPFAFSKGAGGTTTGVTGPTNTTATSHGLLLGAQQDMGGGTPSAVGTGVTSIEHGTTNIITNAGYIAYSGASSHTFPTYTGTAFEWQTASVAITQDAQADNFGTVETNLTAGIHQVLATVEGGFITDGSSVGKTLPSSSPNDTVSASITTNFANDIIVAFVKTSSLTAYKTSTVTGGGLTWTLLTRQSETLVGRANFLNTIECWWAVAPTAGSYTPSAALSSAVDSSFAAIMDVFAVSGVGNIATPFDATTPFVYKSGAHSSPTSVTSGTISAAATKGIMLGVEQDMAATSFTVVTGSGITSTEHSTATIGSNAGYKGFTSSGTQTFPWSGTEDEWQTLVVTLSGDHVTTSGAITTSLTKPSQALSGSERDNPTGTVTTHLTKVRNALSGKETFTGSATTDLQGISQFLTKLMVSGAATTDLDGSRVHILARAFETITGSVTTNIDTNTAFTIEARTFEVFTGSITTKLDPFRVNQALSGEAFLEAKIHTRLGNADGAMVGNVVHALLIIEGPIEMALPPFRPLILGAQLGAAGDNKYYSWRYTDA